MLGALVALGCVHDTDDAAWESLATAQLAAAQLHGSMAKQQHFATSEIVLLNAIDYAEAERCPVKSISAHRPTGSIYSNVRIQTA